MNNKLKYSIILIFLLLYYAIAPASSYYNFLCLVLILLFGIPHGAADHKINASINQHQSSLKYILKYILISAAYVLWWVLMPLKALVIFILISSYHFGQEFLENLNIKFSRVWETMIWGVNILVVPMLITYHEVRPILASASNSPLPYVSQLNLVTVIIACVTCSLVHVIYLCARNKINNAQMWGLIEMSLVIIIIYNFLPFLIAFTLYFVLFHSFNAFKHQYTWLKSKNRGYTIKSFLLDISRFSLLSVFGLVFFVLIARPDSWSGLISYFFIVISVLTLPHSLLFDQFYKFRRNLSKYNY